MGIAITRLQLRGGTPVMMAKSVYHCRCTWRFCVCCPTWTTAEMHAVRDLMRHTIDYVRQQRPKIYSRELIDLIFIQPYCRIQSLVDEGVARRQTASSYLKSLAGIVVLREIKVGREKLFLHPKLAGLLTQATHDFTPYVETSSCPQEA